MENEQFLIILNGVICCVGGYMAICRQSKMGLSTKKTIRAQYAIWMVMFFLSATSWTFGQPASWIQIAMGASILAHLSLGFGAWRNGAPKYSIDTALIVRQAFDKPAK